VDFSKKFGIRLAFGEQAAAGKNPNNQDVNDQNKYSIAHFAPNPVSGLAIPDGRMAYAMWGYRISI